MALSGSISSGATQVPETKEAKAVKFKWPAQGTWFATKSPTPAL